MSRSFIHVGVAGYMGSGKSTFSAFFAEAGYVVIDADTEAKAAMAADTGVRESIAATFGSACVPCDTIDSHALGAAAFGSAENLRRLNTIVQPVLTSHFEHRLAQLEGTDTVLDAALLPLFDLRHRFDQLFWIEAGFDIRLRRLQARQRQGAPVLESRMRLQEQVMPPPSEGWTIVANNASHAVLAVIARTWIKSTIHQGPES